MQEQRCLRQEYQSQMQQYEDKMLQLVTLEEFYYNLAHYEKIVTLVLEKERQEKIMQIL